MDWTWAVTAASLIGAYANVKQKAWGFILWMLTNLTWCIVDFVTGIYSQAFLMFIYFLMALWGFIEWTKK